MQARPDGAERLFQFLTTRGFTLEERWVTGGETFKDGWRLSYASPAVQVIVQYLDAQFEVHFRRAGVTASYLAIDRDLSGRRSGFHGDMFPPEKLEAAMTVIADDIRKHYDQILSGDEAEWARLSRLQPKDSRAS
jgi:hypothetical protein